MGDEEIDAGITVQYSEAPHVKAIHFFREGEEESFESTVDSDAPIPTVGQTVGFGDVRFSGVVDQSDELVAEWSAPDDIYEVVDVSIQYYHADYNVSDREYDEGLVSRVEVIVEEPESDED